MKNAIAFLVIMVLAGTSLILFSKVRSLNEQLKYSTVSKENLESSLKDAYSIAGIETVTTRKADKDKGETGPSTLFGFRDGCTPRVQYETSIQFEHEERALNYYKISCTK